VAQLTQLAVQAADAARGILTQAWSPIGGITSYRGTGTSTFDDPAINAIAASYGKTPAQVMIRWHLQERRSAIQNIRLGSGTLFCRVYGTNPGHQQAPPRKPGYYRQL
jgi:diketogulonate reductase-like aldo/keto reductase